LVTIPSLAHAESSKTSSENEAVGTGSTEVRYLKRRPSTGSDYFDIGLVRRGTIARKVRCLVPVIHPEARFMFIWLMVGWLSIVYESFSAPLFWAFDVHVDGHLYVIASLINSYFILDIVMMFFTAYHDESGVLVLQPGKIARRYRKGWLCFDLVAAVPWEWLVSTTSGFTQTTKGLRVVRVIRVLRCVRAIRVTKLSSFANRIEAYEQAGSHERFLRGFGLFQHIGGIIIMVHWIACMWYYVGVHAADNGKSWVNHMLVEEGGNFDPHRDAFARYWFSVYFVLETMTTVGFGDITPTNLMEVLFTSVLLLLSCPCLGYLTGRVVEVTMSFYSQSRAMREKRNILQRYLSWRHVPNQLGASMRQHLMYVWNATGGNDEV
jgi:voltage-gated potassium channel